MAFEITTFKELKLYIASDLFRYMTSTSAKAYLRGWYIAGFRYTFFMRCCKYFAAKGWPVLPLYFISRVALRHYSVKYGFQIPWQTDIGPGLYLAHFGTIIVNPNTQIGANCGLAPGVLCGAKYNRLEDEFEYPVLEDEVSLSNNAKVLGNVRIGAQTYVGPSCVVTKDCPRNVTVVGIPAKIIKEVGQPAGSCHIFSKSLSYGYE